MTATKKGSSAKSARVTPRSAERVSHSRSGVGGLTSSATAKRIAAAGRSKGAKTRVKIKYDVGYANALFVRGHGANLSWEQGIMLQNVGPDEWVWETDAPFSKCEFKILINDHHYEQGENHIVKCGTHVEYTPSFV